MKKRNNTFQEFLPKALTGIEGLDEITYGGLPQGRPTLICGSAGCGKTLFAMEFIVRGAVQYNEPGVFVSFEETPEELAANVKSLGFDLKDLERRKLIALDFIRVERSEIEITGEFDLEGLFIRLNYVIDSIKAKRIVLDTIESLFSGIDNHAILRAELRRLFKWLKDKGVTAIITGERGGETLTRQGLEEYVSDCVILLDHRISEQYGTRRLRIIKYRGSFHGTNEYPFLISETGISVLPISSVSLQNTVYNERVSTGIPTLDEMFTGRGYYKGTTVLVTGSAGSGKTSILASFIDSRCRKGEKCLYVALEESKDQIIRNMQSIGINLKQWEEKGLLKFHITRPTQHSLELHLALIHQLVNEHSPSSVVIDPISNFISISNSQQAAGLLTRLIDFLKSRGITSMLSNLSIEDAEYTDLQVSSIVDTWLLLRSLENNGERNRTIYILKSRGMRHSNQVREFLITDEGVKLVDVLISDEGVLVGSARKAKEIHNEQVEARKEKDKKILEVNLRRLKQETDAKLTALQAEYETRAYELKKQFEITETEQNVIEKSHKQDARIRQLQGQKKYKENGQ